MTLLSPIVLSHILTIDGSPNPLLAGETLTVTCNACSEFLPSLKWIDSQNNKMITIEGDVMIGSHVLEGRNCTSLSLTFNSLKTSQGGRYTCVSVVDIPFSKRKIVIVKSKKDCFLLSCYLLCKTEVCCLWYIWSCDLSLVLHMWELLCFITDYQ